MLFHDEIMCQHADTDPGQDAGEKQQAAVEIAVAVSACRIGLVANLVQLVVESFQLPVRYPNREQASGDRNETLDLVFHRAARRFSAASKSTASFLCRSFSSSTGTTGSIHSGTGQG